VTIRTIEGVMAQMEGANGSAGTNNARLMMIKLKPLGERKSNPDQIITRLRPKLSHIPGVLVFITNPPRHPAGRAHGPLQLPVHAARAWI